MVPTPDSAPPPSNVVSQPAEVAGMLSRVVAGVVAACSVLRSALLAVLGCVVLRVVMGAVVVAGAGVDWAVSAG